MQSSRRIAIFSVLFILTLLVSLALPLPARADDGTPPPTDPVVTETPAPGSDTSPAATDTPVTLDPTKAATETTTSEADPTQAADQPAATETVADNVAAISDAGAVVVDQNGEMLPLATQEAADVLTGNDPWFDAGGGVIVGYSATGTCAAGVTECHTSSTPIQAVINDARSDAKTIFVEQGSYNEDVSIAKQVVLTGLGTGATTNSFTLNSGANTTGSSNIFAPTVHVNAGAKVQNGIDLVSAGGTVTVGAGTYTEQLVVKKEFTLTGAGQGQTIIKAPAVMIGTSFNPGQKAIVELSNAADLTLSDLTISGPGPTGCGSLHYGIFVGGNSTLQAGDVTVDNVRDNPVGGCQNGNAIRIGSQASGQVGHATLDNVVIQNYQKSGLVIDGPGTTATVTNSIVMPDPNAHNVTAANGIQVSRGAVATITGNTISGNECDLAAGGCTGSDPLTAVQSMGILLYNAGNGTVISGNTLSGNDGGVYNITSGMTTISDNIFINNRYEGIFLDQGNALITGNTISGSNIGVAAVTFSSNTANSQGTLTGNVITGNNTGIELLDENSSDSIFPVVTAHDNSIYSNSTGINNTTLSVVDAIHNWWGTANGPYDPSLADACELLQVNAGGGGDAVSQCVLYDPWSLSDPFASGGTGSTGAAADESWRGASEVGTPMEIIAVTGGEPVTLSCAAPAINLRIGDIEITFTGLCGYEVILDTVTKDNLPGTISTGDILDNGVSITLLKDGKPVDKIPAGTAILVSYPSPQSGEATILSWRGSGWILENSEQDGGRILVALTSPATLILVIR